MTLPDDWMRTLARSGMPPELEMAVWMASDLYASCARREARRGEVRVEPGEKEHSTESKEEA